MEKIRLIGNNTFYYNQEELKKLKRNEPLTYAYFCLQERLYQSGIRLDFINQDKNRVYFKCFNKINKKSSYIMDLTYKEILKMNLFLLRGILDNIWSC